MKWATAVSEHRFLKYAVAECANAVKAALGERNPDLAVAFVSPHHAANYADLPALIRDMIGDCVLVGCSGGGVIGAGREVENRPGFSLAVAEMPGVEVAPFHIDNADLPDGDAPPQAWEELVSASAVDDPHFLLLSDPFSVQGENLLMGLDYAFPRSVKIGGLASGGQRPGANALYLGGRAYDSGAVGVALRGNITVDTIVAQGCRPIGERMQITESDRNLLIGLDGRGAIETLRELFRGLSERDQQLAQQSLFLGVVMDEFNDDPAAWRLPDPKHNRAGRAARGAGDRRVPQRGPDSPVPPARRGDVFAGPERYAGAVRIGRRRRRGSRNDRRGRAAVPVSRTRRVPLRTRGPRYGYVPGQGGRDTVGRLLLQWRDRPGIRPDLPARLHQQLRRIQAEGCGDEDVGGFT